MAKARSGAEWTELATADNALATANRPAVAGERHYITGVSASFNAAAAGKLLEILDGATVIWRGYVHDHLSVSFAQPIGGTAGAAVSARLTASGTLGVVGAVSVSGYTL